MHREHCGLIRLILLFQNKGTDNKDEREERNKEKELC
jgi:hypothetical protein